MINLLIADDEIFTREGLIEMLPLEELGITETRQAFDGINALEIIKDFKPDIILTDVKMPRMNGIELAFEVRNIYPDCSIIFMSGYSDKEFLKSAIELKAVSYVEKPIEIDELTNALKNALLENSKSKTFTNNIKDIIALEMITCNNSEKVNALINSCTSDVQKDKLYKSSFLTVLVKIENSTIDTDLINKLKSACDIYNLNYFISQKSDSLIVVQLIFEKNLSTSKENNNVFTSLLASFNEYLKDKYSYYISVGKIIGSLDEIPQSFITANKNLQYKFFYDYNSIIYDSNLYSQEYVLDSDFYSKFNSLLNNEDTQKVNMLINQLTHDITKNKGTSVSYIKDIYYRMAQTILKFAHSKNVSIEKGTGSNVLESILSCSNIFILKNIIIHLFEDITAHITSNPKKNASISAILDYIHANYSDSNLCLEDISKNTYLTSTYVCVIFKDYMSKTVNKYITEYRIEKAKQFLKDYNINMSTVAQKVGYNDPNYFSKIFRKETSYTPSEYRRFFNDQI